MPFCKIIRGGLCATIQDLGRTGYRSIGVCTGGAMDRQSLAIANLLVGNDRDAAAIEITLFGTELVFLQPALIAVTGADLRPIINDKRLPLHRPVWVAAGSKLSFQPARSGCFAYLAVAGGIAVPYVLGGYGTHSNSKFGGFHGRPLRAGDELECGPPSRLSETVAARLHPTRDGESVRASRFYYDDGDEVSAAPQLQVRMVPGLHADRLKKSSVDVLYNEEFTVSQTSNRLGYRLEGPALHFQSSFELRSLGTLPGTIQLPMAGSPIILMADAAPTGGYPQIGYVISADLRKVAQLQPGKKLRLTPVAIANAQSESRRMDNQLRQLEFAMRLRHLG